METYTIYDMLDAIKERTGMYTGSIDLNSICTYIHGYMKAMEDAEIKDKSYPKFHDFHEFVRVKYNYYESTAGWANMIKAITLGLNPEKIKWEGYDKNITHEQQKNALSHFYLLLDEFREKHV